MNENGDTLLEPKFDYVYGWNSVAMYRNGDKRTDQFEAGLITSDLRQIPLSNRVQLDVAYSSVKRLTHNYFSFWGEQGKGVANSNGEIVVPPIFDRLEKFDLEDEALCRKGKRWGVVDINGEYVIKPKYFRKDRAKLMQLHLKVGLDKKRYSDISWDQRRNGMVPVYKGRKPIGQYAETKNKWGFISEHGEVMSEFIYSEGSHFTNGVGYMKIDDSSFVVRHSDFKPHNILEDEVTFIHGPVMVTTGTNRLTGEIINVIHNNWKGVVRGLGEMKFIDSNSYSSNSNYNVIHKYKEWFEDHYRYGVYNLLWCSSVIPPKYESISLTPDSLFLLEKEGKFGLSAGGRSWIVKPNYDSIRYLSKGTYELVKNENFSTVNLKNGRIFYNSFFEESGDTSIHYLDHKIEPYLILVHGGNFIYKPSFERKNERLRNARRFNEHTLRVELQFGDWGYINLDTGKLIYWHGSVINRKVLEDWAMHLPLLYKL